MDQKLLWEPTANFITSSGLYQFEQWLKVNKGLAFDAYQALWNWSIDEHEVFWESILQYFDVLYNGSYQKVTNGLSMPDTRWFEGIELSYAEHLFRHQTHERPALLFQNELKREEISWSDFEMQVRKIRHFLEAEGIEAGDTVAALLPNIPETIACFIAVNSLGAIWSCCSPDFGVETVIERFAQIEPRIFFGVDGYHYGGKKFDKTNDIEKIQGALPSIRKTVLLSYIGSENIDSGKFYNWDNISNITDPLPLSFLRVPFNHPIWVLYSSGTTGKPKAITHSHGGMLLEHLKYMTFHNDVKKGEHFFWFSTTGWMMWNFLQSSMLAGAIPVLYDGSPGFPDMDVLWKMTEEIPMHHFGTSAPYLTACMKADLDIAGKYDMSSLRSIGSTGAPLPPEVFEWIYNAISPEVWLCSMSGGTDVCTAFVGGNPYLPVYKGFIQSRALGCGLYAYDDNGEPVYGSLGEMVIEKPMPCMPIYFWNDQNHKKYSESYFDVYPGKWRHGDWINILDNGSLIIHGRSDATLNRKGIRIGTAEIYNVLNKFEEIKDSLILNIEQDGGGDVMPLFVVLEKGFEWTEELKTSINQELRRQCSPRHVPDSIEVAPDVPYTLSGKKMEVPVKKLFMGMKSGKAVNKDAIRNPEAMEWFVKRAEQS